MDFQMHHYSTHLPLLAACVARTSGPVLELGCGLYSTAVLHALCLPDRPLLSLDSDPEWLAKFTHYRRCASHTVRQINQWADAPLDCDGKRWSVVLIDQKPAADRAPSLERYREHADLIVCHDSEHRLYDYERVASTFRYRIEWKRYAPWTTVLSDTIPLDGMRSLL